jgi:hypothetical protein
MVEALGGNFHIANIKHHGMWHPTI